MTPEELGYEIWCEGHYIYSYQKVENNLTLTITLDLEDKTYRGDVSMNQCCVFSQKDIDNLQIAYNNLQRDLKELNNENNSRN